MGREKKVTGSVGEELAASYLKKKGYRILRRNFRTIFGEIDIVAKLKDLIVFVEVKTRATSSLGPPYLAITKFKERHIIKNALFYLKCNSLLRAAWRIDIVSVKLNHEHKLENIELIENAVEDDYI
ncbi:MAG: YraN family protein [Candidatus Omnitrophota bacterium]|nr:YraN family protein [Candidatus Omnitrophota bacterium]